MTPEEPEDITSLLKAWVSGDQAALERLTPLVYDQLRRVARRYMVNENAGHTLQPTALVNEAYLRLLDAKSIDWNDRTHFYAVAAQLMRRILVRSSPLIVGQFGDGAEVMLVGWMIY